MRSVYSCALASIFAVCAAAQTYTINTAAGGGLPPTPMAALSAAIEPNRVAVDSGGNVYFSSPQAVFRIDTTGTLTRVAGAPGGDNPLGDGGPATNAYLGPAGVLMDSFGNLYIADADNNRIRKVTPGGTISTVAGNGAAGYSGDNGSATSAALNGPSAVAFDSTGNLYIADTVNNRVRRMTLSGTISTIAGNGNWGYSGDNGPATSAALRAPQGVAVDLNGNVYIADSNNSVVRMVTPGGIISTMAGNGKEGDSGIPGPAKSAELGYPIGLAVDSHGNLYIADGEDACIFLVNNGTISVVAGGGNSSPGDGGPATAAELEWPSGVAIDSHGNVYISDGDTYTIRKVDSGGIIHTIAGIGTSSFGDGGPATSAGLNYPQDVKVDPNGNLYIADSNSNRIRKVTPAGDISTFAGNGNDGFSGDGGPATSAEINFPEGVAVDSQGNLYIADSNNLRVRKVTPDGTISTVAGNGTGGYSGDGGPATSAELNYPDAVAVGSHGDVYIADTSNYRIRKVTTGGTITTVAGNGTSGYSGDEGPATSAEISYVWGIAVDSTGNLYIADGDNNRIRKVTPDGTISTIVGNGKEGYSGDGGPATSAEIDYPMGVAVDSAGNLYISDDDNLRIRMVTPSGTISTIAGNGDFGYSGDGGPATAATFGYPMGIDVDHGNVYFADDNVAVRVLIPPQPCTYSISTSDLGVAASGGAVTATIHTQTGCTWSLTGLPSWITVSGVSSGTGSGTVTLLIADNGSGERTGSFSLGGASVPIRQMDSTACGGSSSCGITVLPHLAVGGEWSTDFFALNSDTVTHSFSVTFYGNDGSSLTLPFTGNLPGNLSAISDSVPAGGLNYYEAENAAMGTTYSGWVMATADASVIMHEVFRRAPAAGGFYEAGVAANTGYSGFMLPFDATTFAPAGAPFYTGFAVANLNPGSAAHVTCTARDQSGNVIPNALTIPALNPMGHWAGYLFPPLTGQRGTLDCSADTLVAAVGFRVIGATSLSSLPVIVK